MTEAIETLAHRFYDAARPDCAIPYRVAERLAILALSEQPQVSAQPQVQYRHKKRGTIYTVIGEAELQTATGALVDGSALVVYRGDDGKLWAREEGEFRDGRFERLTAVPASEPQALSEERAREVLALEWEADGRKELANTIRKGRDTEWNKAAVAIRGMIRLATETQKGSRE